MEQMWQRPLEFTPAMRIALALVAVIAVADMVRRTYELSDAVERRTEKRTDLKTLGLAVAAVPGWSHLASERFDQSGKATFHNVAAQLIVRLQPFPYQTWPPSEQELAARGLSLSIDPEEVVRVDYDQVSVDWLGWDGQDRPASGQFTGRLHPVRSEEASGSANSDEWMVAVISHSGTENLPEQLRRFLDAVEVRQR